MSSLPTISDDLAAAIREKRAVLMLSQREASERIGVSERTLQTWEAGRAFPQPKHRRAIAAFLNGGRIE